MLKNRLIDVWVNWNDMHTMENVTSTAEQLAGSRQLLKRISGFRDHLPIMDARGQPGSPIGILVPMFVPRSTLLSIRFCAIDFGPKVSQCEAE